MKADIQKIRIIARQLGNRLGLKDRLLMQYRPSICPFDKLMEHVPQNSSVLDIGCGAGLWLILLRRCGIIAKGLGIEVDNRKVRTANLLRGPADQLEFKHIEPQDTWPGPFDCVTMIDVLHHIPTDKQQEFLAKIIATQANTVIFKDIDPHDRFRAAMNTLHDLVLSRQRPRYVDQVTVCRWFEQMGFKIKSTMHCNMLWYSHYAIVATRDQVVQ